MSVSHVDVTSYVEIHSKQPEGKSFWSFDLEKEFGSKHIYTYNMEFSEAVSFAMVMGKVLQVHSIKLRH